MQFISLCLLMGDCSECNSLEFLDLICFRMFSFPVETMIISMYCENTEFSSCLLTTSWCSWMHFTSLLLICPTQQLLQSLHYMLQMTPFFLLGLLVFWFAQDVSEGFNWLVNYTDSMWLYSNMLAVTEMFLMYVSVILFTCVGCVILG